MNEFWLDKKIPKAIRTRKSKSLVLTSSVSEFITLCTLFHIILSFSLPMLQRKEEIERDITPKETPTVSTLKCIKVFGLHPNELQLLQDLESMRSKWNLLLKTYG